MLYWKTSEPSLHYDLLVLEGTDQLNASLVSLEASAEYCIHITGYTRAGDGNKSVCFNVTTDEGSE